MSANLTGKKRPSRPPTHAPVDMSKLIKHAGELDDIADEGRVTEEALAELAEDNGVATELYYAALPLADLEVDAASTTSFVVCVGGCQGWGAMACLEALLEGRQAAEQYSIQVRSCLDRCDRAAAIELRTPDGSAVLPNASPDSLREAIEQL